MTYTDITRAVLTAPADKVFAALVDEEARRSWLPPTGMSGSFDWFDASPGGGYRLTLTYEDEATQGKSGGNKDVVEVRFIRVEPPHRLVEETDFVSDDPDMTGTMTMTWTLEPRDNETAVTLTATNVPDGIPSQDHTAAFESTLDNLNTYVTQRR